MKYVLYDVILHVSLLVTLPYFFIKMLTARKYREGITERLGFIRAQKLKGLSGGPVLWAHAVSVGETRAVMPLLRLFKQRHPAVKIAFSTVTQTGNRVAAKEGAGIIDALFYFPFDLSWTVKGAIKKTRPKVFLTVEKEIWPNLFLHLNRLKTPVIMVNGTISERSCRRFIRFGFFFRGVFGMMQAFCARTPEDMKRAVNAGVKKDSAFLTGNIKFDIRPPEVNASSLDALKKALGLKAGDRVIVAGSTHRGEEEIILSAFKALSAELKGLKLILAPRHPERFNEAEAVVKKSGLSWARRSSGTGADVVILDTIGELMTVYSFADAAIVGGSFVEGIGGHNLLEPALLGKPVVCGPYLTTYLNMAEMLEAAGGGLRTEATGPAIAGALRKLLNDEQLRLRTGNAASAAVKANRGAVQKTLDVIERYF
ncbi:MAG: 3-deoxy-D-manno-octulosonic acid transferase [Deltaproteobacteria bacterium]|nr:3-deoxy-D-manno-octulosonic acid transferase [Deltaproteobacteria bacterium]